MIMFQKRCLFRRDNMKAQVQVRLSLVSFWNPAVRIAMSLIFNDMSVIFDIQWWCWWCWSSLSSSSSSSSSHLQDLLDRGWCDPPSLWPGHHYHHPRDQEKEEEAEVSDHYHHYHPIIWSSSPPLSSSWSGEGGRDKDITKGIRNNLIWKKRRYFRTIDTQKKTPKNA